MWVPPDSPCFLSMQIINSVSPRVSDTGLNTWQLPDNSKELQSGFLIKKGTLLIREEAEDIK